MIYCRELLARTDLFSRLKIVAAESLAQLVLWVPSGDLLRFIRVVGFFFRLFLHKLRSAPMRVGLWRNS